MGLTDIDLRGEQQNSMARPRYRYSLSARFLFGAMDLMAGRKTTLAKVKLLEMLASIPYRQWEVFQYGRMTQCYRKPAIVREARGIVAWGREAQDNEYWHLLVIQEKMRADGIADPWYLVPPIPWLMVRMYVLMAWLLVHLSLQRAFLFNAEFEDHAEHVYAQFVADHPEWETQPTQNPLVAEYGALSTWADVFRRIALDERDHRNQSFIYCGKGEHVVQYGGMAGTDKR